MEGNKTSWEEKDNVVSFVPIVSCTSKVALEVWGGIVCKILLQPQDQHWTTLIPKRQCRVSVRKGSKGILQLQKICSDVHIALSTCNSE